MEAVGDHFRRHHSVIQVLKDNLCRAQNRMKQYTDQRRSERNFDIGDWVFLRLQSYRQMTVASRHNLKLSPKYYGPYQVIKKIGEVAYQLQLPSEAKVHSVFHVSLLKKKLGKQAIPIVQLHELGEEGQFLIEPVAILARRLIKRKSRPVMQVLVHWSNLPSSDATWEDLGSIQSRFPQFYPWGQGEFEGVEDVTKTADENEVKEKETVGVKKWKFEKKGGKTQLKLI